VLQPCSITLQWLVGMAWVAGLVGYHLLSICHGVVSPAGVLVVSDFADACCALWKIASGEYVLGLLPCHIKLTAMGMRW
jgi:hypothetical protein